MDNRLKGDVRMYGVDNEIDVDIDIVILNGTLVEKLNMVDEIYRDMVSIA